MAAYPFAQMPTMGEFIDRAKQDYGCEHEQDAIGVIDQDGEKRLSILRRTHENMQYTVVLPSIADETRLSLLMLRNLCRRLNISPADFGLGLDE